MPARDFYYIAPELSLFILAVLLVLLDLATRRKGALAVIGFAGLAVPAALALALWGQRVSAVQGLLVVDEFSVFFKLLFLGAAGLVILASQEQMARFEGFKGEYYALVLLAATGMMLMAATQELISLYVAIELSSLSLYALAGFLKDRRSAEAGMKYLLLGAVASAVMLYGMALVFGVTGTTSLPEIARAIKVGGLAGNPVLFLGLVFLVAGFGFKIAAFPFQMWVPDVYEGAPTPITAYLSVASKAAGFAVILRVFYAAFGPATGVSADWAVIFAGLSAITMTIGNLVAIAQSNIKRMLAYSSIAHAGYLMVGLATISVLGQGGVLFYLASYAFANLGAFIVVIAIGQRTGSDRIDDYSGMVKRAPGLAFSLAFCLLALTGIPPTSVFWSKVYIFNAAVQGGLLWLVVLAVINSVISAYYYLRVVKVMLIGAPPTEEKVPSTASLRAALAVSTLGVLVIGLIPAPLLRLAEAAVAILGGF